MKPRNYVKPKDHVATAWPNIHEIRAGTIRENLALSVIKSLLC